MKKKALAVSLIAIVLSFLAMGTVAMILFYEEGRTTNVITTSGIEMVLTEAGTGNPVIEEGKFMGLMFTNVLPGQTVGKQPSVTNSGEEPFWLRVKIEKTLQKATAGVAVDMPLKIDDVEVIQINGITADWVQEGEWLYFTKKVTKDMTVSVFDSVTFAPQMGNEYKNTFGDIVITAEAIQCKNNDIPFGGSITSVWPD